MVVESTASAQSVPHFHIYLPLLLWTLGTLLVVGYLLLYCHQNTLSWRTIINLCMKRKWTSLILWSPNYMDGTIFAWGLKSLSSNIWPLTLTIDINIGHFFCFWTNTTQVFATSSLSLTHIFQMYIDSETCPFKTLPMLASDFPSWFAAYLQNWQNLTLPYLLIC